MYKLCVVYVSAYLVLVCLATLWTHFCERVMDVSHFLPEQALLVQGINQTYTQTRTANKTNNQRTNTITVSTTRAMTITEQQKASLEEAIEAQD